MIKITADLIKMIFGSNEDGGIVIGILFLCILVNVYLCLVRRERDKSFSIPI